MNAFFRLFSKSEIIRRFKSFAFASNGMKIFFTTQTNALIEILSAIVVIVAGVHFSLSYFEWALIILAIGIVFIAEIFNTSIEFLTNLASPEYNKIAGKVKDLAAAGVLMAVFVALVLGAIVFIPKFN